MFNIQDIERQLLAAMQGRELILPEGKPLKADGKWQRCTATNVRNGKEDGSYQLHLEGAVPWALYRNWTDGKGVSYWRGEAGRPLTEAERLEHERARAQATLEAEQEAAEAAKEAAEIARRRWDHADVVRQQHQHPYLKKKKIAGHKARIDRHGDLLVPIYNPENSELVNLQIIADDGQKWFLRGGRVTGYLAEVEGNLDCILLAEGFATSASLNEATRYSVGVAFSAGNLSSVAMIARRKLAATDDFIWLGHDNAAAGRGLQQERQQQNFVTSKLIIAADDDWKTKDNPGLMHGLAAARAAHALIAIPEFGDQRADGDTDFNDMARKHGAAAVKAAIDNAVEPQVLLEKLLLAKPHSAHGEAMVAELAAWKQHDPVYYETLLAKLKKKGVRAGELDRAVKEAVKAEAARTTTVVATTTAPVNVEALAKSAQDIIANRNVLALFIKDFHKVFVGETKNAKLLYLICTSRLFAKKETMHAAVKGTSAVGKSGLMNTVADFIPVESVYKFTGLAEKALVYEKNDFEHKVLIMAEAQDAKQQAFQDYCLRELMSESILRYPVPMKIDGQIETVTIVKNGPVAFLVSTTKNHLYDENETRVLTLEMDDSPEQTKRVMLKVAQRVGRRLNAVHIDFDKWHDFQRWLAAGERTVWVPFADVLAELIPRQSHPPAP